MHMDWPKGCQRSTFRVCHPTNTDGTTWLRESDLVFVKEQAFAVFQWSHGSEGEVPEVYIELKPALLAHDGDARHYRYDGELPDPTRQRRPA